MSGRVWIALVGILASTALVGCDLGTAPHVVEIEATAVTTADLNADGLEDIAAAGNDTLAVHLSDGLGDIATARYERDDESGDVEYTGIAALDVDSDDDIDLIVRSYYERSGGHLISMLNDGAGELSNGSPLGSCDPKGDFATGDVDGDGIHDIVVVTDWSGALYRGNGDGTFTRTVLDQGYGGMVDLDDLDGDGLDDVLMGIEWFGEQPSIAVHLSVGDGTFGPKTLYPLHPDVGYATALRAGDVNADGMADVVVQSPVDLDRTDVTAVSTLLGQGDGTFAAPSTAPHIAGEGASRYAEDVELADIDSDGSTDAIVNGIAVVYGDGVGGFDGLHGMAAGADAAPLDLDEDGVDDIVSASPELYLLLNRLDGSRDHN
jgi:hypothetical protein